MKTTQGFGFIIGLLLSLSLPPSGHAREASLALRYNFPTGQTNVYSVEYTVRSENGMETNSGNLFVVSLASGSNVIRLSCRAALEGKRSPARPPFGFSGGMYPGTGVRLPEGCEIQIDSQGRVLRASGDFPLPAPLGELVKTLIQPLPAKLKSNWETTEQVLVVDDPLWLGPAGSFLSQQTYGSPYFMSYSQRAPLALITCLQTTDWRMTKNTPTNVTLHKKLSLASLLATGGEPRLVANGEGDLVFDRVTGMFQKIEMQFDTVSQTEAASRTVKVSIRYRLLQGEELAKALNPPRPPAPPAPPKLTGDELAKFMDELKSSDPDARRNAANRLRGVEVESPSPELLNLATTFLAESDAFTRQSAAAFVCKYATSEQMPALLKLLKNSDWSLRQSTLKAITRLKDERAIAPLVDLMARGGQLNQPAQEINTCLIGFGPAAEKPVLELLNERNAETRQNACAVLRQIGTNQSLESLQKITGDPDQQVSQAAVEAIRAIQSRQ